jgi:fluoroacetyl-CoA thioesterase
MNPALKPGLKFSFDYVVPRQALVPTMYDIPTALDMPPVLATGYMVGIMEFACVEAIKPYMDWPREQSLGTRVEFTHLAATPEGMKLSVSGELIEVDGRRLRFRVQARDEVDQITEGFHERTVIDRDRFLAKLAPKMQRTSP